MKNVTETSGETESYCERCDQDRKHSFNVEETLFNKKKYLETSFVCYWCGTRAVVEGTTYKRAKMTQNGEACFDFG